MEDTTLRAGGLASGLDTNLLVEQLTNLQRRPIELMQKRQEAFKIQLSGIGRIKARLEALNTAAADLAKTGIISSSVSSENTGFSSTASGTSPVGSFGVQVDQLARAAKARSAAFTGPTAPVNGGTLTLGVGTESFELIINDGSTMADVAAQINGSGAPVSASLISDGTSTYLSVTRTDTGHAVGGDPNSALTITENYSGFLGQDLGLVVTQTAQNAHLVVDGLAVERASNTITDVIPGTTLTLKQQTLAPENLVLNRDMEKTEANVQAFVKAYNDLMALVQGDLNVGSESDRSKSLAGDPTLRFLQTRMQRLVTTEVASAGTNIRTMGDMGIKSNRDGSLTLDAAALADAISRDPNAVRSIFTDGADGITKQIDSLVELQTDPIDGVLSNREDGIKDSIDQIDSDIENQEIRVEAFKKALFAKFIAMESIISGLNSIGNYLAQQKFPDFGDS